MLYGIQYASTFQRTLSKRCRYTSLEKCISKTKTILANIHLNTCLYESIFICAQIDYQCNTNTNLFRKTAAGVQNLFLIVALFLLFLLKFIFLCSGSRYFVYILSLVNKCVLYILVYISCSLTALPFPCCCNHAILVGTYNKINKYLV